MTIPATNPPAPEFKTTRPIMVPGSNKAAIALKVPPLIAPRVEAAG